MPYLRDVWNPFDFLIERDTPATGHPDIVFGSSRELVPVVGLCLVDPYGFADTTAAERALQRVIVAREMAVISIDTRLDTNRLGMRTPSEIESTIARVDVMLTTRLHGMVMALKHGVPTIAVDPEPGGAKIVRQAKTIGWPFTWAVDAINEIEMIQAFDACFTPSVRSQARRSAETACEQVDAIGAQLIREFERGSALDVRYRERLNSGYLVRTPPMDPRLPRRTLIPSRVRRALRPFKGVVKGAIAGALGRPLEGALAPVPVVVRKLDMSGQPITPTSS